MRVNSGAKIVFVNRFFYPDISATSQILTDLVFSIAQSGFNVTVITSRSAYQDQAVIYPKREKIKGVTILRVGKNRFNRLNFIGRFIDISVFYVLLSLTLLRLVKKSDVLVCMTDPPLLIALGALVKKIKKNKLISWNQDLFPEVAHSLFDGSFRQLLYRIIQKLRNSAFKQSDVNVVISHAMAQRLLKQLSLSCKVIPNWSQQLDVDTNKVNQLADQWQLTGKFVIAYSGNFGFAHEYETIKSAIIKLAESDDIVFLFIGSGQYSLALQALVLDTSLPNVIFKQYQPRDKLAQSMGLADMHLISLQEKMEGLVFPSKFYGICASAKPILFVGSPDSELAQIIEAEYCGVSVAIGDSDDLVRQIQKLKNLPDQLKIMGDNALKYFNRQATLQHASRHWSDLLVKIKAL